MKLNTIQSFVSDTCLLACNSEINALLLPINCSIPTFICYCQWCHTEHKTQTIKPKHCKAS